ncbi:hypothetical protein QL285_009176 [Trifolium repens]|nr:hypothetical protein QL285_009176 [Trifolium repens]
MNSRRIFEVKCLTQKFHKNHVWTGLQSKGDFSFSVALILIPLLDIQHRILQNLYLDRSVLYWFHNFGQEVRAVAISKVGHKMQNFAEGLERKINTFSWPIKGRQVIRSKDLMGA